MSNPRDFFSKIQHNIYILRLSVDLEVDLEVVLESGGKTRMANLFVKFSRSTAVFQSYGVSVISLLGKGSPCSVSLRNNCTMYSEMNSICPLIIGNITEL